MQATPAIERPPFETVWSPIPNSSQEFAIDTRCDHTLYEGARGPGKTVTQLMAFRRFVGIGYGEFWRGVIFDLEFDNLSGLVAESKKWFPKFFDGAKFLESASQYKWTWPTGEELLFRHVKKIGDYEGFHGHEYPFIGWNELTKFPTSELYDKFMSTNRSTFKPEVNTPHKVVDAGEGHLCSDGITRLYDTDDGKPLPPIPLKVFSTTNPNGPGHGWVKRRFIDAAPRGKVVRKSVEIFNPQTQTEEIIIKTQIAIFGSYRENIYLPPGYIAELEQIKDKNLRRAWLFGDWDIVTGGALDDVWDKQVHVLPRFAIPRTWSIDRALDWGSSHPFSVGWFAEANGEEAIIHHNGREFSFCPPAGTLIQFAEWYGTAEIGTNKGLKLSAGMVADGIKEREEGFKINGWITTTVWAGPADNSIRDVREIDVETIESKMAVKNIEWERSDKSPGSRKNGLQLMRDRLEASTKGEGPGLYFMDNCVASISTIPTLPRDPDKIDDVDTTAEDHPYDMVRYRTLKGGARALTKIPLSMPK